MAKVKPIYLTDADAEFFDVQGYDTRLPRELQDGDPEVRRLFRFSTVHIGSPVNPSENPPQGQS